jgi:MFS family permease
VKASPHRVQNAPAPWLTRTVWGFGLASLFSDLGHELVTALTPGFLLSLGAPPMALGVIEGVSNFAMNAAKLVGGRLADRPARRRAILLAGYAATGLKALFAVAGTWGWLVVIRTVGWIGRGARGPARDAVLAEEVPRVAYGRVFGFREAMDTVGAVAGPLLGALLLHHLGYRTLFGWTFVPSALALLAVLVLVRVHPSAAETDIPRSWWNLPASFRRFIWPVALFAVANVAPTFFILRATELLPTRGVILAGSAAAVLLYTVHNACYALGALPAGAAGDARGAPRVLAAGYAALALALVGFALGPSSFLGLLPLFVLTGASAAMVESMQSTVTAHLLPREVRASGLGLTSAVAGFGQLASSLVVGALWTAGRAGVAFAFAALAAAFAAVLALRVAHRWAADSEGEPI